MRRQPRVVFRVAAGPRVGFGHLMRARALAAALDARAAVSVRGGRSAERAAMSVGLTLATGSDPLRDADALIVDDPSFDQGGQWVARARRAGLPSVSVHDEARAHDADLVICGSLGVPRPRAAGDILSGARFYLLDRRIAIARRRFTHRDRARIPASGPRVLLALGGGQHVRALARDLVAAIVGMTPRASIVVAAGFSSGRPPALHGARWLSARAGLTDALVNADLAVVGGGVTLYEACALGVPSVGLAVVPAQYHAIRAFADRGAIVAAGIDPRTAVSSAAAGVAMLAASAPARQALSRRARQLVDGRGAERVARRIRVLIGEGARQVA